MVVSVVVHVPVLGHAGGGYHGAVRPGAPDNQFQGVRPVGGDGPAVGVQEHVGRPLR